MFAFRLLEIDPGYTEPVEGTLERPRGYVYSLTWPPDARERSSEPSPLPNPTDEYLAIGRSHLNNTAIDPKLGLLQF